MRDILGLCLFRRETVGLPSKKEIEFHMFLLQVEKELQFWMLGLTAFQSRMEEGINEFPNEIVLDSGSRMSLLFLSAYTWSALFRGRWPTIFSKDT